MRILLVCGYAGSGKSTFVAKFSEHLRKQGKKTYLMNLDPAVESILFEPNLDIRDTIDYKGIMKDLVLGPNGATMACMNIFVSKIDQITTIMSSKTVTHDYIMIDTPGQIEMFTWSSSGDIIAKSLKTTFTDVSLLYVVDGNRCFNSHRTMASNILHACSVSKKMDIPMKLIFTKMDI
ncbi:GPN-loop GTPase, partial [Blyttiomyces helicus]